MSGAFVAGHFGEWLQGRLGPDGPVALVTLPCAAVGVEATLTPRPGRGLRLRGGQADAAARLLAGLGVALEGEVTLRPRAAAPGLGTGVSTASLVALARLAGWRGPALTLARACVGVEGASDPLMFAAPERVLWASRAGRVLGWMPAVPGFAALGGFVGPPRPTDATDDGFDDIADLVARWRGARRLRDFAAIASESASRCVARRGPAGDPTAALAARLGALGWTAAHTGAARALIFAPGCVPAGAGDALRAAGLRDVIRFDGGAR